MSNMDDSKHTESNSEGSSIQTEHYHSHYEEKQFWKKLSDFALQIGSKGVYYALLLYFVMVDPQTPFAQKAIIAGALGYLILPIDLIPDFIVGVGFSDDIGALYAALQAVQVSITETHRHQAKERFQSWFPTASIPNEPS